MRRSWLLALLLLCATSLRAQTVQNATLRRAQQSFDNLEYRQALTALQASLRERLTGFERARAYELLGFTYSGMDSILKAVDAFKQLVLIEAERDHDPTRTSTKALSAFQVALTQILVVRQLRVDSVEFIGGQGAVAMRYTVTQPSRVVTRITGGTLGSIRIDSTVANGQVNIRWPARMPSGDPVPAGNYNVVVEATVGKTASRRLSRFASRMAPWIRCPISPVCRATPICPRPKCRPRAGGRWVSRSCTRGSRWPARRR